MFQKKKNLLSMMMGHRLGFAHNLPQFLLRINNTNSCYTLMISVGYASIDRNVYVGIYVV